jgi:VWFA-related protein
MLKMQRNPLAKTLTAFLVALALTPASAQQQQPPARADKAVSEGVTAVLVDVVVRDKRGQPVADLSPTDFELSEDGTPQKIGSFTPIFANAPAVPAPAPSAPSVSTEAVAASAPSPNTGPIVTALVFDRLSPEARQIAVQAAQSYLGNKSEASSYIGIFGIDLGLAPYAPFTKNVSVLRQALSTMAQRASASFNNPQQQQQKLDADQQAASANQAVSSAAAAAGPGASAAMGTAPAAALLAQMQANMIKDFDLMERDQQGYSTTNGLSAIIKTLRRLPGRKSLVLFSEGLAVPPAVQRLFLGVIDAANRANVAIYTMDAAGLRAESEQAKIRDEVNRAAGGGTGIQGSNGGSNDPLSKALERNEGVLRQDPRNTLGTLAQDTGGLIFDSTNSLRQGLDRIDSDLHNYYLIGYTPTNEKYDGRFRAIEVKVKRPGLTVSARKGYFAVRDPGVPVDPFEAAALSALQQKPVPNAFPVRAGALLFPEGNRPGLVPVVVDLKTAPLTFQPSSDGKTYSSDFTVLVRFIGSNNEVAKQISQHYEVKGPLDALDRAKQGEVIFYREPELDPGVYSMETVVHDGPTGRSSVRISTVEVPRQDVTALRMSSLVLVKRGEKVDAKDRRPSNPLLVNDTVLYPNLGETVSKSSKEIGFYFAVYPTKSGPTPQATLQLLEDGKAIADLPITLSAADNSGRIQQVGRLPLERIAPGTYELRAIVKQGQQQLFKSVMLFIAE